MIFSTQLFLRPADNTIVMSDNQIMLSSGCKIKGERCKITFPSDAVPEIFSRGVRLPCSFDEKKDGYMCGSEILPAQARGKIAYSTARGVDRLGGLAVFKNGERIGSDFVLLPATGREKSDKAFFDRQAAKMYNVIVGDILTKIVARDADDLYFKAFLIADLACAMIERGDVSRAYALLGEIDDILAARGLEDSCAWRGNSFCPVGKWISACRDQIMQWIVILETKWGNLQNAKEFADAVAGENAREVAYSYLEKYSNAPDLEFPGYRPPQISHDEYQRQLSSIEAIRDPLVKASFLVMLIQTLPY